MSKAGGSAGVEATIGMTAAEGYVTPQRTQRDPLRLGANFWSLLVFAAVAAAVVIPLVFLIFGSFSTAQLPGEFSLSALGLQNHIKVWTDPSTYRVFSNTFWYVTGSTAIGLVLAATLAWLVERTDMPG